MELVKCHLAAKLIELRGTKSLYEVSQKVGIPMGRIADFENGLYLPDEDCLLKLAYGLGVELFELKRAHYDDLYSPESLEAI